MTKNLDFVEKKILTGCNVVLQKYNPLWFEIS